MCPYVSSSKFSVLVPHCSRALLHNLQPTSDRCLIFASHLTTGMILAIAIFNRLLCLQGMHWSIKYFPKSAPLSFCRNMKSAVHVPFAWWFILSSSALARTHNFKNFLSSIQVFCCKTFALLFLRCLILLLVCAVFDVITFTLFVISSTNCAHLSPSACKPLFMFLHLILCCPSAYCIPHAIIKCRIMILIIIFPASRHGFFHVKTARFVCWHHSLPTFRSEIALFARMSAPSFTDSPRCAFTFTKKVAVPAAILFRSICQFRLIWAGALFLTSHFALLHFLFLSQVMISCSHFASSVWTVTCSYLALKPIASEHAYLCAHPVITLSHFQSHLRVRQWSVSSPSASSRLALK